MKTPTKRILSITVFLFIIILISIISQRQYSAVNKSIYNFKLSATNGQQTSLKKYAGNWLVVFFGYTTCPDICPTSLAYIANEFKSLKSEKQQLVKVIFLSVDPGRDDPEKVSKYVQFFHPDFHGYTAAERTIANIAQKFDAFYTFDKSDSKIGYSVSHSADFFIVSPEGYIVDRVPPPHKKGDVIKKLSENMVSI